MRKVIHCQFHVAVESMGSILSFRAKKNSEAIETQTGIEIKSKGTGRIVIIPYSNIRSYEVEASND